MTRVRNSVAEAMLFYRRVCGWSTPIVDMISYPFMDLNFATGLHKIMNAVLYLIIHMPHVTHLRCSRHASEGADLEPVFDFLVSGIRYMGYMVNNWANVVYVIAQNALGISKITCDPNVVCENRILIICDLNVAVPLLSSYHLKFRISTPGISILDRSYGPFVHLFCPSRWVASDFDRPMTLGCLPLTIFAFSLRNLEDNDQI